MLRSAPAVFETLRWGGALYLTYLGFRIFRAPVSAQPDLDLVVSVAQPTAERRTV